jgi:arylsulfatase A-like enzyme
MKFIVSLLLCQLLVVFPGLAQNRSDYLVEQEIQYHCEDAEEVFIVWGINGWNKQQKELLPAGTFEKGGLLTTPMKNQQGVFSIVFKTKPNTMFDYVFWITKGPKEIECDIWDVNVLPQKDYHSIAINDNSVVINSKVKVKPAQPLSVLEYTPVLVLIALFLFGALYLVKRFVFKTMTIYLSGPKIIVAGSILLLLCLFIIRVSVARLSWDFYYDPVTHAGPALWSGYYDYLYVLVIFLVFIGLHFIFKKFRHGNKIVISSFIIVGFISLLAALINIRVVEIIGKPFNYQWFYYSGFLNTSDSNAALAANISAGYIFKLVMVCICATLFTISLVYMHDMFLKKVKYKRIVFLVVLVLNIGFVVKAKRSLANGLPGYERLANPVTAFAESINPFSPDPELFTMEIADSLKYKEKNRKNTLGEFTGIKNVIMVVLESTPANVVAPYDKKYKATPNIEGLLNNAIVFDHVYAHAPATNKTMFSVLCSSFPWLSYNSETQEFPGISIPSMASVLKKKGYRTAFFNSGDNRFQSAGEFLSAHDFETIKDYSNVNCNRKFREEQKGWDALNGLDDACTANELIEWIHSENKKPFFGVIWTYQTHYPYFCGDEMQNFNDYNKELNKYLNAVKHSDEIVGRIVGSLKASGHFDSTLVVIIGDHGEAFGTHDQKTHASKIYEENIHIPCLFINPAFKSKRLPNAGGVADIAPTVLSVLNVEPAEQWQGVSLFERKYSDRTYFFCPWSDYLFGFREGKMKYIFNATKNSSELYDLEKDPLETRNLAAGSNTNISVYQQKLAAWVQYQDKYMKKIAVK